MLMLENIAQLACLGNANRISVHPLSFGFWAFIPALRIGKKTKMKKAKVRSSEGKRTS